MFDTALRRVKDRALAPLAAPLRHVPPMAITAVGFAVGLGCAGAAYAGHAWLAVGLWLANRTLDGLDGAVARFAGTSSDRGGYLDLLADFAVYAAIPVALVAGASDRGALAVPLGALLGAYYVNAVSWLALSAILERRRGESPAQDADRDERLTVESTGEVFAPSGRAHPTPGPLTSGPQLLGAGAQDAWGPQSPLSRGIAPLPWKRPAPDPPNSPPSRVGKGGWGVRPVGGEGLQPPLSRVETTRSVGGADGQDTPRRRMRRMERGVTTLLMPRGLIEGTETVVFVGACLLSPEETLGALFTGGAVLVVATAMDRAIWAWRRLGSSGV